MTDTPKSQAPREFWIDKESDGRIVGVEDLSQYKGYIPGIHVIEKSAYDQALVEIEQWKKCLDISHDRVLELESDNRVHFLKINELQKELIAAEARIKQLETILEENKRLSKQADALTAFNSSAEANARAERYKKALEEIYSGNLPVGDTVLKTIGMRFQKIAREALKEET